MPKAIPASSRRRPAWRARSAVCSASARPASTLPWRARSRLTSGRSPTPRSEPRPGRPAQGGTMAETLYIPIDKLVITKTNARKEHTVDKALLASLRSVGMLYPLTVQPLDDGTYDVVDGAQRLMALRELKHNGTLEVECRL